MKNTQTTSENQNMDVMPTKTLKKACHQKSALPAFPLTDIFKMSLQEIDYTYDNIDSFSFASDYHKNICKKAIMIFKAYKLY